MNSLHSLSLLLLLTASAVVSAQSVTDGSFENTPEAGWEYAPIGTAWTYTYPSGLAMGSTPWHDVAQDGNQYAFIQSASNVAGGISGSITGLTTGQAYDLQFYLGSRGGYVIDPLDVSIGGATIATNVAPADDRLGTGWTKFDLYFVAPSSSTSVGFMGSVPGYGQDLNTAIDNITIQSTPEPASYAVLGLGALGLVIRRRAAKRS